MHCTGLVSNVHLACCCRDEIASCSERAYKQLSVAEAQKLMLFSSAKEASQYAEQVCMPKCCCSMYLNTRFADSYTDVHVWPEH